MLSMSRMMMDVTAVTAAASFCDFACVCVCMGVGVPVALIHSLKKGKSGRSMHRVASCLFALRAEVGAFLDGIDRGSWGKKGACACSCRFFPSPLFLLGCLACFLFFFFLFLIYNDDLSVWFGVLDGWMDGWMIGVGILSSR